jgi:hypothetical protein
VAVGLRRGDADGSFSNSAEVLFRFNREMHTFGSLSGENLCVAHYIRAKAQFAEITCRIAYLSVLFRFECNC